MKKNLTLAVCFLACTIISHAQATTPSSPSSATYSKGDNILSVGIGIGSNYFGSGYSASIPVNPTVSFEHGFTDAISAGVTVSYASSKYKYGYLGDNYSLKESATYIGVRGAYHFNKLLKLDNTKFDVYGGLGLGYVVVSVSSSANGQTYSSGNVGSGVGYALFVGGRYYFSPRIGVYAELGYASLSVLNAGVSFKF